MYEIEKGVLAPAGSTKAKYPFSKMEIGDSFAVPLAERLKVRNAVGQYKCRTQGFNYVTKTDGDSLRIWRVK